MTYSAGIDWGGEQHAACVIDQHGAVVLRLEPTHTAEGLQGLVKALARIAPADQIPVAIERPDGVLVDTLSMPATR